MSVSEEGPQLEEEEEEERAEGAVEAGPHVDDGVAEAPAPPVVMDHEMMALQVPYNHSVVVLDPDTDKTLDERHAYKLGSVMFETDEGEAVTSLHYDGELLFAGTHGGKLYSWDVNQDKGLPTLDMPSRLTAQIEEERADEDEDEDEEERAKDLTLDITCFDIQGDHVVAGHENGALSRWALHTGAVAKQGEQHLAYFHKARVSGVQFVGNNVFSVGHDGYFLSHDLNEAKVDLAYVNCTCPLSAMVVLEPHSVMIGSWDGTIRHLDLRTSKVVHEYRAGEDRAPVRCLFATPDTLFCSHSEGGVRSWDLRTRTVLVDHYEGNDSVVNCLQVHNNRLFTGADDGSVRVYDVTDAVCIDALGGHGGSVLSMQIIIDTDFVVVGGADGTVRTFNLSALDSAIQQRRLRMEEGIRIAQELLAKQREEAKSRKKKKKGGKKKKKNADA